MSSEDLLKNKQMIRSVPSLGSIPKMNRIIWVEGRLKSMAFLGTLGVFTFAFGYKLLNDIFPAMFNPTTKQFQAVPDFTSKQIHVYYREVPNKPQEY